MPNAIGFDFDGVIVDSTHIKTDAFRHLFAAWPQHVPAIVDLHESLGGISRIRKFEMIYADILCEPLDDVRRRELAEGFTSYVFDAVLACPLIAGAQAFLEEWSPRLPMFVVSGTPDDELKEIVSRRGLDRYFTEVHGSPREKPDILSDIMARHGLKPKEMPFVGDATTDEDAARTCGMMFIGIAPDGVGPFASPDVVLRDLTGLAEALGA